MISKWILPIFFYLLSGLFYPALGNNQDTLIPPAGGNGSFAWGANGHPLNQEAYWENLDAQMEVLKKIGLTWYRVDIGCNEKGLMSGAAAARFRELVKKTSENHITILPVIMPPAEDLYIGTDLDKKYRDGYNIGSTFASNYGKDLTCYELGNENDIPLFGSPAGDGSDTSQYDIPKLRSLAAVLRGISDGIKNVNPVSKIIISNGGWMHYAYFKLLEREGVKFDIIGYHWYEDILHFKEVLRILRSDFADKPVWFTEINIRYGGRGDRSAAQNRRMRQYVKAIGRIGKNVMGFFVYELFDQPASALKEERNYGLVSWKKPYISFTYKPVALNLQSLIKRAVPPKAGRSSPF